MTSDTQTSTTQTSRDTGDKTSGFAPVNGLQMYYEIHGSGPPLVSIHPFANIALNLPELATTRQVIAVELQGHGRTADMDRPMTYEQHADDVAALMMHLAIRKADIFGYSLGGITATQLVIRNPDLVRRVATYGTSLGKFTEVTRLESIAEFMSLTPDSASVQYQRGNYQRVAPDPSRWPSLFANIGQMPMEGFTDAQLQAITQPYLIVAGDHDVLSPSLEHMLHNLRRIPNAQLAVIPDAGHFVVHDEPHRVAPILARFFDQTENPVRFATPGSGYHPGQTR